jgi:tetratricopeptide (TPR) repeat protein
MGSLRFRRSIKIGPGVRLGVSKTGLGVSFGTRGARYSVHSSGRRTASAGVPGTGLGYTHSSSGGSGRSTRQVAAPVPARYPKPGWFAPKHEKAFHKGLQAYGHGNLEGARQMFRKASEEDREGRVLTDDLMAGLLSLQVEKTDEAIPHLEKVVASDVELPDDLMRKYGLEGGIKLKVTEHVEVEAELGSLAAALALVECYQVQGRNEEAIGVLQQLADAEPHPALILSLCDLYAEQGAWDEIVEAAAGTQNEDDLSLQVRLYQGDALLQQGMREAALDAYRDALRSKKRNAALLTEARYSRGKLLLEMGKRAQARKDLERVYADDPNYEDVEELLRDP